VWAFATAGVKAPRLFDAIAAAALPQLGQFTAQNLANTVWAFATAGEGVPELFEGVAVSALPRLGEFKPQNLANTAWAFATAGFKATRFFDAIADEALPRLRDFSLQELANTAWAFATAGVEAPELFEAIAAAALPRLGVFKSQDFANIGWALACSECATSEQVAVILDAVMNRFPRFDDISLSQLYQLWLYARSEHLPSSSSPRFEDRSRQAYMRLSSTPSALQRDVSGALSAMGWTHDFEHVTGEGLSLDLARPSLKQGLEVDGPSHYLRDTETGRLAVNGATRLKTRLLEGLGWTVARVPFYEWRRLKSEPERRRYLEEKLAEFA